VIELVPFKMMKEQMDEIEESFNYVMNEIEPEDAVYAALKVDDENGDVDTPYMNHIDDSFNNMIDEMEPEDAVYGMLKVDDEDEVEDVGVGMPSVMEEHMNEIDDSFKNVIQVDPQMEPEDAVYGMLKGDDEDEVEHEIVDECGSYSMEKHMNEIDESFKNVIQMEPEDAVYGMLKGDDEDEIEQEIVDEDRSYSMRKHMNEIDDSFNNVIDETEPEDAVYGMLNVDDEDDDPPSDDTSDDVDGLLEPFPERPIDHDRRPRQADIDAEEEDKELRPGDHIYVWKSVGVFGMRSYQKHGIVLSVDPGDYSSATIVTFYHENKRDHGACDELYEDNNDGSLLNSASDDDTPATNGNIRQGQNYGRTATVRTESLLDFCLNSKGKVFKVKYDQGLAKRLLRRGGTVSACKADANPLILARIQYLLQTSGRMPEYQMMSANGECAAVWCCIGRWCTLQGSSILHILFIGQAGGALAGGLVASNVFLWAPVPGMWGYIWYVPATVAFPLLTPVLIGFGLASLVPLEVLRRYRNKWAEISKKINTDFWLKTHDDVKDNHFESTVSANEIWMQSFFGQNVDKEELEKSQYMPLDVSGDDIGSEDDEDEDEMTKRISAEYGMTFNSSEQEEQCKEMAPTAPTKGSTWQNMLGRVRSSFVTQHESKVKAVDYGTNEDFSEPLNDTICREIL